MDKKSVVGTLISILLEILLMLIFVLVVWNVGKWAYNFGYQVFAEQTVEAEPGTDISFAVSEGESNRTICKRLEEAGLINNADTFFVRLMLTDYKDTLTKGEYTLNTSMKSEEMMAVLSGETLDEEMIK